MGEIKVNYVGFGKSGVPEYITDIVDSCFDPLICDGAEFVFVGSSRPNDFSDYLKGKVSIFFPGEAIAPDFNLYDYAVGFDELSFGDRYLRYLLFPHSMQRGVQKEDAGNPLDRKFCNFIYQNRNAHPARDRFFHLLSEKYKTVESLGRHLKNVDVDIEPRDGNWYQGSIDAKSNYKFSIAFENASHRGYTTEKITSSFQARTIPIYWGNPGVADIFNPDSFINCHDFDSFDAVIEEVRRLDRNDAAYLEMLNAPKGDAMEEAFYLEQRKKLESFLVHILRQPVAEARRRPEGFWNDRYRAQLSASRGFRLFRKKST